MEVENNLTLKETCFYFHYEKKSKHQSCVVISVGSRMIIEAMGDAR